MMEYTVTRVVTIICGVLLIATILPPVQSLFDDGESSEMQEQSQNICRMIDTFYISEADEMVVCLNTVLPKDSFMTMEGYFVTVHSNDTEYRYDTVHELTPDRNSYGTDDIVRFTRNGDAVMIEAL